MQTELDQIDKRLERIEVKLDNHLERVAKSEEAIAGMRGQIRLVFSLVIAAVSSLIAAIFRHHL